MDIKKAIKLALTLTVFCAVSAALLSSVDLFTKPIIEYNQNQKLLQSLKQVLPGADKFDKRSDQLYLADIGAVAVVKVRGYSADIKLLVGVDNAGKVAGVNILDQRETPGLGSKISQISFLKQFNGKTEINTDVDAITGATISSQAVRDGIKKALEAVKP